MKLYRYEVYSKELGPYGIFEAGGYELTQAFNLVAPKLDYDNTTYKFYFTEYGNNKYKDKIDALVNSLKANDWDIRIIELDYIGVPTYVDDDQVAIA